MTQEEIKFAIDQLRKDKIIYALEACATSLACILLLLFSNQYLYLSGTAGDVLSIVAYFIGFGYTIYMGIGNFMRLRKIKKLEKQLLKQ